MTFRQILTGCDFTANNLGRSIKLTTDRTNLKGEYLLGGSQAVSVYNGADTTNTMTVTGTPVYGAAYATLAQANWCDTGILDNAELTILAIADATNQPIYVGNFSGTNTNDCVVMYRSAANFVVQTCASDGTNQQITSAAATTGIDAGYRGLALRTTGTADYTSKLDQFEAGVRAGGTSTTHTGKTREVQTTPSFAIGSARGGAFFVGPVNVAGVLIWHRALSDAELLAAYQEARTTLALRGITC